MRRPNDGRDTAELRQVIRTVRLRWRTRHLLKGLLLTGAAALAALVVVRVGLDRWDLAPAGALALGVAAYLGVALVALRTLLLPLLRRVSDRQVALYLEEHEPALQAEILTAVETLETEGDAAADPFLVELVRAAVQRAREVEGGRRVEREPLRRLSWASAGAGVVAAVLLLADPLGFRTTLPELMQPWSAVEAASPAAVLLAPGDTAVPRGAELRLSARLQGFEADRVELAYRPVEEAEASWDRWPMVEVDPDAPPGQAPDAPVALPAGPGPAYHFTLFQVDEELEYFVEADGVRSGVYRVSVLDLPYVGELELEVRPPAYTGLPAERIERGGDVAALPGTRVTVRATPTLPVPTGRIVFDEGEPVELAVDDDGRLTGEFTVERSGFYRIELDDEAGATHRGTPDHVIDVLENAPPVVSLRRPGRDVRTTSVDEVFVEARAADDHGIAVLELVYSVNGGDPRRVSLLDGAGERLAEVSAGHTFFLEEYDLEPGDLVAYHARALDVGPGAEAREARTDLFFIQVQPFDREFRQADEQPGGVQGDGQGDDQTGGQLSNRQREVVTATFNVLRDERFYEPEELAEAITTIALAQERLHDEVRTLVQRLHERGVANDPEMRQVARALPAAVDAMAEALRLLREQDPDAALSPEQQALQHLLRAEAAFREVQVSMGSEQQQGGGGGDQGDDLADYFDLEMDRMRNQYEELQRGEREMADRQLDETQERLRELARRQQQESERLRRAAERLPQGSASAGGDSQRRLAEETEELARQLERLAREQSSPEMEQTAQQLREAAESMRRSAASRDERGIGQAEAAQEALEEARRLMDRTRGQQMERDAQAAEDRARRALQRQERIQDQVERLPELGSPDRREAMDRLGEQKEELRAEVEGLQQDLRRLAREASDEDREAARELREAADAIRDGRIPERIEFSRGLAGTDRGREFEEEITTRLREVAEQVQRARGSLDERASDGPRELMERTRELLRGAESMAERARRAGDEGARADDPDARAGDPDRQQAGDPDRRQAGDPDRQAGDPDRQQAGDPGARAAQEDARGGGGGVPDAETVRQLRREAEQRVRDLEELGRAMGASGVRWDDYDRVMRAYRSLTADRPYGDRQTLEAVQREILESLRELDFVLRRQFAAAARDEAVVTGRGEVPEGYRELVEEYFRNLARSRP